MKITEFNLGPLSANCYLLTENGTDAVLIDCGGADSDLVEYLNDNNINLKAILLTHGHYDHICGVPKIKDLTGAVVYLHEYDNSLTKSAYESLFIHHYPEEYFVPFSADRLFVDDEIINEAGMTFKVMHCPGHTMGSSCFIVENKIFCGDALFRGSIGRSDFPHSDPVLQRAALAQFTEMQGDFEIYCGHGENTTLSCELKTNPYLRY